jgi:hypothetical protein
MRDRARADDRARSSSRSRCAALRSSPRRIVLAIEDLQDGRRDAAGAALLGGLGARVIVLVTRHRRVRLPAGAHARIPAPTRTRLKSLHRLGARGGAGLASLVHRDTGGPGWIEPRGRARARLIDDGVAARRRHRRAAGLGARRARARASAPRDRSPCVAALLGDAAEAVCRSRASSVTERPAIRRLLVRRLLVSDDAGPPERLGVGGDEGDERMPASVRVPNAAPTRCSRARSSELRRLHSRIVATLERLAPEHVAA